MKILEIDRGFGSEEQMSQLLGLEMVGKISPLDQTIPTRIGQAWANQVVKYAEIALIGTVLLVIVSCLVQPAVRAAFIDHPLHGLARMTWMFLGN